MTINEAQAQATVVSGRGDGGYPSGLHDGAEISTAELKPWLKKNWNSVRQALIDGNYPPRATAGWRRENLRHPDGGGQAYPAGDSVTVKHHRGQKLLRLQLRLPAGA